MELFFLIYVNAFNKISLGVLDTIKLDVKYIWVKTITERRIMDLIGGSAYTTLFTLSHKTGKITNSVNVTEELKSFHAFFRYDALTNRFLTEAFINADAGADIGFRLDLLDATTLKYTKETVLPVTEPRNFEVFTWTYFTKPYFMPSFPSTTTATTGGLKEEMWIITQNANGFNRPWVYNLFNVNNLGKILSQFLNQTGLPNSQILFVSEM